MPNEYPRGVRTVYDFDEFIFTSPPQEIFAAEKKSVAERNAKQSKAAAAWKARGGVRIGMTPEQALKSNWGKPTTVNRTTTPSGIRE